jgi:hypothetical protein
MSTLRFGQNAKKVCNNVRANYKVASDLNQAQEMIN